MWFLLVILSFWQIFSIWSFRWIWGFIVRIACLLHILIISSFIVIELLLVIQRFWALLLLRFRLLWRRHVRCVFVCWSQNLAYSFLVDIWFGRQLWAFLFEIGLVLKWIILVLLLLASWIYGRLSFLVVGWRLIEDDGMILILIWLDIGSILDRALSRESQRARFSAHDPGIILAISHTGLLLSKLLIWFILFGIEVLLYEIVHNFLMIVFGLFPISPSSASGRESLTLWICYAWLRRYLPTRFRWVDGFRILLLHLHLSTFWHIQADLLFFVDIFLFLIIWLSTFLFKILFLFLRQLHRTLLTRSSRSILMESQWLGFLHICLFITLELWLDLIALLLISIIFILLSIFAWICFISFFLVVLFLSFLFLRVFKLLLRRLGFFLRGQILWGLVLRFYLL